MTRLTKWRLGVYSWVMGVIQASEVAEVSM